MLKRLLTCLALLTGLTAAGVPAQARMVETLTAQLASDGKASAIQRGQDCVCTKPSKNPLKIERQTDTCRPAKPVTIFLPTVQFGPDRAFE